jgi:4-deoxy-L-threo-5-hexosulose-uronate ketol-isomerase
MNVRHAVGKNHYERMSSAELRAGFHVGNLFLTGELSLTYWETERTVLGGIVPAQGPLRLPADPELASTHFCERREACLFNLGGPGSIGVDGQEHGLGRLDALYVGRGAREITLSSPEEDNPARFFLISYPAHAAHPTRLIRHEDANRVELGSRETANERVIHQYVHRGGAASCQLVTGLTRLATGSVWNTMPPHTHLRRSEVYLYFDLASDAAVFHFMGAGDATRHLVMRDGEAALSPPWSIHSGCGTGSYGFIWAMGGENQEFTDMDAIPVSALK